MSIKMKHEKEVINQSGRINNRKRGPLSIGENIMRDTVH